MSTLLLHQHQWLTPLLYPELSRAGVDALAGLAEWVYEFSTPVGSRGEPARSVNEIHPSRLDCPLPQAAMVREFVGYVRPDGGLRERHLQYGLAALLTHGVIRARHRQDRTTRLPEQHPTYTLIGWLEPALARAMALRDVTNHLAAHPIGTLLIDGVATDAAPAHGTARGSRQFERTLEVHDPATPAEAATLLLRKVELEWVGKLGAVDHPEWRPDGLIAADLLYAAAEIETGTAVIRTPVPAVSYRGSRPVVTAEIMGLLPVLEQLPQRMRITEDEPATAPAPTPTPSRPSRKPAPKRTKKDGSIPASAWAAVGVDRGNA